MSNVTNNVEKRVVEVVAIALSVEKEKVVPTANFVDDLGSDSLDAVELVMAFEEEFDIEIPDDDAERITTVQATVDYIKKKQK